MKGLVDGSSIRVFITLEVLVELFNGEYHRLVKHVASVGSFLSFRWAWGVWSIDVAPGENIVG